jgi:hypothetical protein
MIIRPHPTLLAPRQTEAKVFDKKRSRFPEKTASRGNQNDYMLNVTIVESLSLVESCDVVPVVAPNPL